VSAHPHPKPIPAHPASGDGSPAHPHAASPSSFSPASLAAPSAPVLAARLAVSLAAQLRKARLRYRSRLRHCRRQFSEKSVHALRVESRRILALLDLVRGLGFEASTARPRKLLKKRLKAFNTLRDLQVQRLLVKTWISRFPAAHSFAILLKHHEQSTVHELRARIASLRARPVTRRLRKLSAQIAAAGVAKAPAPALTLAPLLDSAIARVVVARGKVRARSPATIHQTRVALKRLRYLCEILQPWLPVITSEELERMRQGQVRMGEVQDIAVLLAAIQHATTEGAVPKAELAPWCAALRRRLTLSSGRVTKAAAVSFARTQPVQQGAD